MNRLQQSRHSVANLRYLIASKEKAAQNAGRALQRQTNNQQLGDDENYRRQTLVQKRQAIERLKTFFL